LLAGKGGERVPRQSIGKKEFILRQTVVRKRLISRREQNENYKKQGKRAKGEKCPYLKGKSDGWCS